MDSDHSPMYLPPGSQLKRQIFSRIFETVENFSGCAFWDQEKLFDEKSGDSKSHGSVPLRCFSI